MVYGRSRYGILFRVLSEIALSAQLINGGSHIFLAGPGSRTGLQDFKEFSGHYSHDEDLFFRILRRN